MVPGKESTCQCRLKNRVQFLGRNYPWSRNGHTLWCSCLESSMDREPGRQQSVELQKEVGHDWACTSLFLSAINPPALSITLECQTIINIVKSLTKYSDVFFPLFQKWEQDFWNILQHFPLICHPNVQCYSNTQIPIDSLMIKSYLLNRLF